MPQLPFWRIRFSFFRRIVAMSLLSFRVVIFDVPPEVPPSTHTEQGDVADPAPPGEPCVGC